MRILVAGGAGFLASHLCDRFLALCHEVVSVDNFYTSSTQNLNRLRDHPSFESFRHYVTTHLHFEVDGIFNFACPVSPIHYLNNPVQTLKTNLYGSINTLDLAKQTKARIV